MERPPGGGNAYECILTRRHNPWQTCNTCKSSFLLSPSHNRWCLAAPLWVEVDGTASVIETNIGSSSNLPTRLEDLVNHIQLNQTQTNTPAIEYWSTNQKFSLQSKYWNIMGGCENHLFPGHFFVFYRQWINSKCSANVEPVSRKFM